MPRAKPKKPKAEKEKPVVDATVDIVETRVLNPDRPRVPILQRHRYEHIYVVPTQKTTRNLRDDHFARLHHRHQIGEAQYRAGRQFQSDYEAAGTTLRSSGHIQEPVDGSPHHRDGVTDRQIAAFKALAGYRAELGAAGYRLIEAAVVQGRSFRDIADTGSMMPGKAATTFVGHRVRECLTALARLMGYAP